MTGLIVLSLILLATWVAAALAVGWLCQQIAQDRLERNTWAGIRTSWTLASDEAWHAAHRAALPALRGAYRLTALTALLTAAVPLLASTGLLTVDAALAAQGVLSAAGGLALLAVSVASLRPARRAADAAPSAGTSAAGSDGSATPGSLSD